MSGSNEWLKPAAKALQEAEVLIFTAGAGMGVDSGLPDFRGPEGFWRAYPPMKRLGLSFADSSNPQSFQRDPRFGWGFFGHRYQLYTSAVPHEGYHILHRWGEAAKGNFFVFTSNVDGHFLKAGFPEDRVVECHGSIHFLQAFNSSLSSAIYPAEPHLRNLKVDPETFLANEEGMPMCPPETGKAAGSLARPNILMFGDWGWVGDRTEAQEDRLEEFLEDTDKNARVVIVEIGAGKGVPTVRNRSESFLRHFRNSTLLRINPAEPDGPKGTISIPKGGKVTLEALDQAIGGPSGIGSANSGGAGGQCKSSAV